MLALAYDRKSDTTVELQMAMFGLPSWPLADARGIEPGSAFSDMRVPRAPVVMIFGRVETDLAAFFLVRWKDGGLALPCTGSRRE